MFSFIADPFIGMCLGCNLGKIEIGKTNKQLPCYIASATKPSQVNHVQIICKGKLKRRKCYLYMQLQLAL